MIHKSVIFAILKILCLILSVFLFIGSSNACGVSDLPCPGQTEQSSDCCKSSKKEQPSHDDQNTASCCQAIVVNMPVKTFATEVIVLDKHIVQNISMPIFNHSYDFHMDVWQPPKLSC